MRKMNIKTISTAFLVFICALALSVSSASYGHISSHGKLVKEVKYIQANDICMNQYQKVSYTSTQPNDDYQTDMRSKSQAMAVGILFGARHALGPVKRTDTYSKVQAIKEYRSCQKERALKS
jgi:hypothetical protein